MCVQFDIQLDNSSIIQHNYFLLFDTECTQNEIRLMGSSRPSEGRVEVCIDRHWTTVCDDGWGSKDAQVVCRQLGYPSSGRQSNYNFIVWQAAIKTIIKIIIIVYF